MLLTIILFTSLSLSQQLGLEISSLKEVYFVGEPIQILISIKNIGTTNVEGNFYNKMKLELNNANGSEIKYVGPSVDTYSPATESLLPSETVYRFIELNRYFGKIFNIAYYDHYLDSGRYTLMANLTPVGQQSIHTEIPFQVIDPSGEELKVYNTFLDITDGEVAGKYSAADVAQKLENLHRDYPNSVYSINILTLLDAVYDISLHKYQEASRVREELVFKYPSVRAYWTLDSVLRNRQSKSDKINFIRELQLNSSNPLIQKVYEQKIKDLEKN